MPTNNSINNFALLPTIESTASNTVALVVNTAYIATSTNGTTLVVFTLPATAALGSLIKITGKSTAYWKVEQNAGQTIHDGAASTTTGVAGNVTTAHRWASICLKCITADTNFTIVSKSGTITLA